jgi:hypothetical protein
VSSVVDEEMIVAVELKLIEAEHETLEDCFRLESERAIQINVRSVTSKRPHRKKLTTTSNESNVLQLIELFCIARLSRIEKEERRSCMDINESKWQLAIKIQCGK